MERKPCPLCGEAITVPNMDRHVRACKETGGEGTSARKNCHFLIPVSLYELWAKRAQAEDVSKNTIMTQALQAYLQEEPA